jgi:hypothetical protein
MNAYKIDPRSKTITPITINDSATEIAALIGFKSIGFDEIDTNGDRLYFDEACFINEQPGGGRFKLDSLPPVAGLGVVIGWNASADSAANACVSPEALAKRVQFL